MSIKQPLLRLKMVKSGHAVVSKYVVTDLLHYLIYFDFIFY